MLITLLQWVYLLPLGWLYGRLTLHLLARAFHLDATSASFGLTWLSGLAALSSLAMVLSLFIKLALAAQIIVLTGGLLILFWQLRNRRVHLQILAWHPLGYIFAVILLLTVLEISTHTPGNPDTGLYHAQTIRWIETYPAVPGLGNLHSRLAYNSSWLTLNALFSFTFLGGQSYHPLPGLIVLVVCGQFLNTLSLQGGRSIVQPSGSNPSKPDAAISSQNRRTPPASNNLRLLFIPLAFFLLAGELSSPGTDLPAVMIAWLIFSEWLALIEDQKSTPLLPAILILLTLWAITIKLSTLPLLLAALLIWWQFLRVNPPHILSLRAKAKPERGNLPPRKQQSALTLLTGTALTFLPWAIRSLILSGYLVYPGFTLDPFRFDWRIPPEAVVRESATITAWARFSAGQIDEVLAMSLTEWINAWFHNQTPNRQIIFLVAAAAPFVYALFLGLLALIKKDLFQHSYGNLKKIVLPLLTAYTGIAFWFFNAPFFRFGYTFLIPALLLWMLPIIQLIGTKRLSILRIPFILLIGLIIFQGNVLIQSFESETLSARLVQPADYVNLPTAPCELHNTRVWCAEQFDVCGYASFPCIPQADPLVAARGPDLSDGFRHLEIP